MLVPGNKGQERRKCFSRWVLARAFLSLAVLAIGGILVRRQQDHEANVAPAVSLGWAPDGMRFCLCFVFSFGAHWIEGYSEYDYFASNMLAV